ncbi:MAG: hypothetical protein ABIP97_01125 [Chthoniobacterales bacterium]
MKNEQLSFPVVTTEQDDTDITLFYDIFPEKSLIFQRYTGKFSLEDILSSTQTLWADPRYSVSYNGILDLRESTLHITTSDLQVLIKFFSEQKSCSHAKWAVITNSTVGTAFILLYKKALAHKHSLEAFSTMEGACAFLNIDSVPGLDTRKVPPKEL